MLLSAAASCGPASQKAVLPRCSLEFRVYDEHGNSIPFVIRAARLAKTNADALAPGANAYHRMTNTGDRLYADEAHFYGPDSLVVTLADGKGRKFEQQVEFLQCEQRISIRYGESYSTVDGEWSTIRGRVTGCQLDDAWWVRATPMFGQWGGTYDGYLRPTDGAFEISAPMKGERHMVIIGKGKQPVRCLGVDVSRYDVMPVGTIDLSRSCPK